MSAALSLRPEMPAGNGFASRCTFRCVRCDRTGSRSETFRPHQPTVADRSSFVDRCPNCGSHDIEVSAPPYQRPRRG